MRALALVALVGCTYTPPGNADNNPMIDGASIPDGPAMCAVQSTECIAPAKLRSCDVIGQPSHDDDCLWGCTMQGGPPRCGQFVPAGGGVAVSDLDPTGLGDVTLHATVDGNTGAISGTPNRNAGAGPDQGIAYLIRNNVAVFRMKSLHVTGGITALTGDHPIAFVVDGPIVIDDLIDVRGPCSTANAGPGGFAGGAKNTKASGNGGGDGANISISGAGIGGAGGGYGGSGGDGGAGILGIGGGGPYGDATITTLLGGGGGGGGNGSGGGVGGGGGGGIQLVSNTSITINLNGGINAGGCGGKAGGGGGADAGGGGGAGGTILLEAPLITIAGKLAVNGGGGGNKGADGQNATLTRNRVGGAGGGIGQPGQGGAGDNKDGGAGVVQGGGGGGIGRIRLDLKAGTTATITGVLSPSFTDQTTATQGDAKLQ